MPVGRMGGKMEDIQNWLVEVLWPFATANLIPQIAVIVVSVIAIFLACREAWRHMIWLRNLEDTYFFDVQIARLKAIKRKETIERKLDQIEEQKSKNLSLAWMRFTALFVMGIVVPTGVMLVAASQYDWFFPGAAPLIDLDAGKPLTDPDLADVASFMLSQIAHAPLDLLEVFGFDVSRITFDRSDRLFALLVFLYRSLIGGFMGAAGVFLYRVVRFRNAKGEDQLVLEEKLADLDG